MITQDAFTSGKALGSNIRKNGWHQQMAESFFVKDTFIYDYKGKINFTQMGRYSSSPKLDFAICSREYLILYPSIRCLLQSIAVMNY